MKSYLPKSNYALTTGYWIILTPWSKFTGYLQKVLQLYKPHYEISLATLLVLVHVVRFPPIFFWVRLIAWLGFQRFHHIIVHLQWLLIRTTANLMIWSFVARSSTNCAICCWPAKMSKSNEVFHLLKRSRHTVVCRAVQKNGACANRVSILKGTTKSRFSCICCSVMRHPKDTKFTVELAFTQGRFQILTKSLKLFLRYESANFHKFFFIISHTFQKLPHNSRMRAPIWLKFGIRIGSLKANPSIDF